MPRSGTALQARIFIHLSKYTVGCYLRYCGFPRRTLLGSSVNKDREEGEAPLLARQLPSGNGEREVTPLLMDGGYAKRKPRPVTYGDSLRVSRSSSRACVRSSRSSRLTCARSSCSSCRFWSRSFSQSCSPSSFRFLPTLTFSLVDSPSLHIVMGSMAPR